MKIRPSIKKKQKLDRTPCEAHSITLTRIKPIDPSEIYGLQKWEWLKELVAVTAVCSLNAFHYVIEVDTGCADKVDKALAGMTRDSGGLFKAKAKFLSHKDPTTDLVRIKVDWADDKSKQAWDDNARSMRRANPRFRERRPELVSHAAARNQIRQKTMLKEKK